MADRAVNVVRIEIETPPNKTVYAVGESFDPTGMVVRAYYSNLTNAIIQLYTYSPSGPLAVNDHSITVSFSGKTDSVPITVTDRFYPQNIEGSNLGKNPYFNLFDQSIRFITEPISINRDSYALSFNFVHHSRMPKALSDLCLGLPDRFKTNYHQFIIQDGTDSNNNSIYKYIDGEGYVHSFYKVSGNLYYSGECNSHLIIDQSNPNYYAKIVDSNNNQLLFNSNGALFKTISGIDNTNVKSITYSNGRLTLVKDDRHANTYIQFNYDGQNRLSSVAFVFNNQTIKSLNLNYDNSGSLTDITEVVSNNSSRTLYCFDYASNNRISLIEDCLNHVAYGFEYAFANGFGDYLVNSFKIGYLNSLNEFTVQKSLTRTSFSTFEFCDYQTSEIKFIDHNNRSLSFSLDKDAQITASFAGSSESDYRTLYNETGINLSVTGDVNTYVNSHRFINVTSPLTISLSSDAYSFIDKYVYFVVRFYLRLNNTTSKRVRVYGALNGLVSSSVDINVKQQKKFQLVEVPFKKVGVPIGNTISLYFVNENNNSVNVDVGDIYIDKKAKSNLWFLNGQYSFDAITRIELYDSLNQSQPTKTISTTGENVFSKADFLNSVLCTINGVSLLYSNYFNTQKFPLYLNNGQTVEVYGSFFALFVNDTCVFNSVLSFVTVPLLSNFWHFETLSPDDKSSTRVIYRYIDGCLNISNKRYEYDELNDSLTLSQEEINNYNPLNGQLLDTTKNYYGGATSTNVIEYEYFNNGELKKATQTDNNETIILYEATQNNSGYLSRMTSGLNSYDVDYNDYLESIITHNRVTDSSIYNTYAQKQYGYNVYKDIITSVAFKQSQVNKGTNNIFVNGLEEIFSINSAPIYKLNSNTSLTTLTLSRYNGSSYDAVLSNEQTESINETTYYDTTSVQITNNYDAYGRIISQELDGVTKVSFNYQNNIEHPSVAHLYSVSDGYIEKTFYFYTDEANYINRYTLGIFTTIKNQNGNLEYEFYNEATYKASLNKNILTTYCDNSRLDNFSIRYIFDTFNRETGKQRSISSDFSNIFLIDNYTYVSNSFLPSSYQHISIYNQNTITHVNESYDYDSYGNLSSVQTTFRDEFDNQVNNISYTRTFAFDGFNRLLTESNTLVSSFSKNYSYYNDGKMEYFGSNHLSYNDNGQLEYFGSVEFEYDNYGNRKTKTTGNNQVAYNYERGKLLSSITQNDQTVFFKYDYLGRRYKKESFKEVVEYYYDGNRLIGENHTGKTYYENNEQKTGLTFKLRFFYNSDNTPNGVRLIYTDQLNQVVSVDYIYIVNKFKEIVGITCASNDSTGYSNLEVNYIYDAWGSHKVYNSLGQESSDDNFIGYLNPFRFKGYYYDQETGLYYLMSRYYDPSIGQFISPDEFSYLDQNKLSGYYLYAYCNNNPVMSYDPNGHIILLIIGTLIVTALANAPLEIAAGFISYWIFDYLGWIEPIGENSDYSGGTRIKNGFLLPGFFSKMTFILTAQLQGKFKTDRSLLGLTIEWGVHNLVSYAAFMPAPLHDPILILSIQIFAFYLFVEHTKDVDLENSPEWYKFWRR